jgi:hypothetical protein
LVVFCRRWAAATHNLYFSTGSYSPPSWNAPYFGAVFHESEQNVRHPIEGEVCGVW